MQLIKSALCIITVFLYTGSFAQHLVRKIDGEKFSFITKIRIVPILKELCLPAVALNVSNRIKHDPTYDVTKFKEFLEALTTAYSLDSNKLVSLMHEEIEVEWKKYCSDTRGYSIDQLHFSGNKFIWTNKVLQKWDIYAKFKNIENNEQPEPIGTNNLRCFTISSRFCCTSPINSRALLIKDLETNKNGEFFINKNRFPIGALALDQQIVRCAVGNDYGEIFIGKQYGANFKFSTTKPTHTASITALYFTPNSTLFSCDTKGNIFVWDNKNVRHLPLKQKVASVISSADSMLVAFAHAGDENRSSILNWNALTITEYNVGKIVAFTSTNTIVVQNGESLLTYNLNGDLLQSTQLRKAARLFGNEVPSSRAPLYLMTTEKIKKRFDNYGYDYTDYPPNYHGQMDRIKIGTEVEMVKTTFWLPKQLSPEELYVKIASKKSDILK